MIVVIKPEHWRRGKQCGPATCAVACAIIEQYGEVDGLFVTSGGVYAGDRLVADVGQALAETIRQWDMRGTIPTGDYWVEVDLPPKPTITLDPLSTHVSSIRQRMEERVPAHSMEQYLAELLDIGEVIQA